MIKDYVLYDIITTNAEGEKRPVFFAVTIPQENMKRYFPYLQMEGMAYRLMDTKGPDNLPGTDADKVMENMLGVYRLGALMTGDTPARQRRYAEMAGRVSDSGPVRLGVEGRNLAPAQCDTLMDMLGEQADRRLPHRQRRATCWATTPRPSTAPATRSYQLASKVAMSDTTAYQQALHVALTAFDASLAVRALQSAGPGVLPAAAGPGLPGPGRQGLPGLPARQRARGGGGAHHLQRPARLRARRRARAGLRVPGRADQRPTRTGSSSTRPSSASTRPWARCKEAVAVAEAWKAAERPARSGDGQGPGADEDRGPETRAAADRGRGQGADRREGRWGQVSAGTIWPPPCRRR